mmetsp:Transcript_63060/g.150270  ORF Transcript_63060/g.150270 Transcript_63060/m.150270 type:complete len:131 (+) Transcript_63060:188-580(+)
MYRETVYVPDDEVRIFAEDLTTLLAEGTTASVAELCARGPSAAFLIGCCLVTASLLIVALRLTWAMYASDIAEFYHEAEGAEGELDGGATADVHGIVGDGAESESTTACSGHAGISRAEQRRASPHQAKQ